MTLAPAQPRPPASAAPPAAASVGGAAKGTTFKPLRLGDVLIERGVITEQQLQQALAYQKDRGHKRLLGEVLIELGYVTDEGVMETLAETYGVPFAKLHPRLADPAVLEILPREFLEEHNVLPLFSVRGKLTLAMHEPSNVFLVEEIERLTKQTVQIVCATEKDLRTTLESLDKAGDVFVIDDMIEGGGGSDLSVVEKQVTDLTDLESASGESPVIKLVNYVIFRRSKNGRAIFI